MLNQGCSCNRLGLYRLGAGGQRLWDVGCTVLFVWLCFACGFYNFCKIEGEFEMVSLQLSVLPDV